MGWEYINITNLWNPNEQDYHTAGNFSGLPIATYAETLTLDPDHTHVRFAIGHMGTSTNHGGFYNLTGELNYDRAAKTGAINLIIPMSSLDTNTKAFNEHLLSKDFFNVAKYPTATFTSTQWHFDKDKVTQVDGNLTLLGKTRPISLTATNNCYFNFILKNLRVAVILSPPSTAANGA